MANENGNSSFAEARRNADITSMIPDANSSPNTATAAPPPPSSNNPNPSDASPPAQTSPAAGPAAGPAAPIPAAPTPAPAIATPAASSSPAQSEALREDMLKSAISFLSSANVQSAPTAKKIAFLRQKGLSQQEIEEAFKRVGSAPLASSSSNSSTTMTTPPSNALTNTTTTNHASLPPIPPRPRSTHVIYYQPPPPPVMPAQRVLTLALLMGFGAVGATAALVGIIRRLIGPIFKNIARYQRGRYNDYRALFGKVQKRLEENKQDSPLRIADARQKLTERLDQLTRDLKDVAEDVRDEPYSEFRDKLGDLKYALEQPDIMLSTYSPYSLRGSGLGSESPAVQSLKSEIRSLKGTLLSRRNFPMAKPTLTTAAPTTTSTSTAAAVPSAVNTTPEQQETQQRVTGGGSTAGETSPVSPNYHPRRRQDFRADLPKTS